MNENPELLEPGTQVRTRGSGLIGTVLPYDLTYCQDRIFPVLLHNTGVTRQMACDELDVLPTTRAEKNKERAA